MESYNPAWPETAVSLVLSYSNKSKLEDAIVDVLHTGNPNEKQSVKQSLKAQYPKMNQEVFLQSGHINY